MSRLGFSKFKIARRSGSESWQTISPVLKTEETVSPDQSLSTGDRSMPILERILKEKDDSVVKSEEETAENDSDSGNKSGNSDLPQMSISACYSLAEGQDNSDIPDIDEIRASTLTDGNNMIVLPLGSELREDMENNPDEAGNSEGEEKGVEELAGGGPPELTPNTTVCAVTGSRNDAEGDARTAQTNFIRPTVLPATATAAATLMTLQQQVMIVLCELNY